MFITTYNGSMQYKEILDDYIAHGNKNLSAEDEKAKVDAYMQGPFGAGLDKIIGIEEGTDDWITKTIDKIDSMLSNKYSPEERRALYGKYPETIEKAIDWELQGYMDFLRDNSIDGKPTIVGKMVGLGTAEEEAELEAFVNSFSEDTMMSNDGAALFVRADLSIEEFKTLFAKAREKATKDVEEQRKQIIKEEQEYNVNFAKEQSEKKFKPMQVKKKYETYDINKDQKFIYARELLNFKEKRGIDVLELMQKIDKKQILNKMV